jgi:DNA-binding NarL/FixJ family response regulator
MKTLVLEAIPLLREAIVGHLTLHPTITDVQCAADIPQALDLCTNFQPDLVWLDGELLEVKPEVTIRNFKKVVPEAKMLLFGSGDDSIPEIKKYFKLGILAYLPKTTTEEDLDAALDALAAGHLYVPTSLQHTFTSWLTDPVRKTKSWQKLTPREKEVLNLIVEEHTAHEIAIKLFISQCTVETHRVNLIQKLGVKNTAGLVRVAFEAGLYQRRLI